jgi:hypothetical protein
MAAARRYFMTRNRPRSAYAARASDPDQDVLTSGEELMVGTNPLVADTDSDGCPDSEELPLILTQKFRWFGGQIQYLQDPNSYSTTCH